MSQNYPRLHEVRCVGRITRSLLTAHIKLALPVVSVSAEHQTSDMSINTVNTEARSELGN